MEWEVVLKKLYSTPGESAAFSSVDKLYRSLKDKNIQVNRTQIKKWLNDQFTHVIHKPRLRKFPRNPILASNIDDNWQADILFLPHLGRFNDNKPCILICIDVVSRFAFVEPMRSKSGIHTAKALQDIISKHNRYPRKLQTDKGREFYNKHVSEVLKKYNISLYSTESDYKAAIAERFVKEIKKLIYKYKSFNKKNRYIDVLQDLVKTYNNTWHSTIKYAPADVSQDNLHHVLQNLYGDLWKKDAVPLNSSRRIDQKFNVGDQVRISLNKDLFGKGYTGFWTTEVFTIETVKHNHPHTQYVLKTAEGEILKGLFYNHELQPVYPASHRFTKIKSILQEKIIKKKKWVLVNWENEDPELKQWIRADELH